MGSTISAIIRIRNLTYSNITTITIYDFNNFDFGSCRPDKVFNGKSVSSKSCIEKSIDYSTMSSNCPFTIKLIYDNETEDIFRLNFKILLEIGNDNMKHFKQTHNIKLKKSGPRVLEIIIENTQEQIENYKAEQLINEGRKLMNLGKFNEASIKFMEASQKANDENTKKNLLKSSKQLKIIKKENEDDQKAKNLNNEGLHLLKNYKFSEAMKKFQEAQEFTKKPEILNLIEDNLKIAKDARNNQQAKEIHEEGLEFFEILNTENALIKFNEALKITNDPNLIKLINSNKSECLKIQAEEILEKAWCLDTRNSQDAIYLFSKSKFLFQEANCLQSSEENEEKIFIIDCKIQAEKLFNSGVELETSNKQNAGNLFKQSLEILKKGKTKSINFEKSINKVLNRLDNLILQT